MNKIQFTQFIIKNEKFYNLLNKDIQKEISQLDDYNLNLTDPYTFFPNYIGKKNNKKCFIQFMLRCTFDNTVFTSQDIFYENE